MFQTFISRHNSNFFSDKLVLTSVTPASSAPVLQTPKRSEERFSRNAETDLVCRLLLEKKNRMSWRTPLLCYLKPGRRFAAFQVHRAGGIGVLYNRLI